MTLEELIASRGWRAEKLDKGWSGDEKYLVTTKNGERLLLRRAPVDQKEKKRREFEAMHRLDGVKGSFSRPLEWIECEDGACLLVSWLEGQDAEKALARMTETEKYHLGIEAGELLRRIHTVPAPEGLPEWGERFSKKLDRKRPLWLSCPVEIPGRDALLACVDEGRGLLFGRPQCFQHGDYHVGNQVVDEQGRLGVIDFNRWDYGDPWEEFNRVVWCAQASAAYASGYINGYFGGVPGEAFFRLLRLYIAANQLSSVPWAIPFGQGEIDVMTRQARQVLDWYDGMRELVPSWYRGHE